MKRWPGARWQLPCLCFAPFFCERRHYSAAAEGLNRDSIIFLTEPCCRSLKSVAGLLRSTVGKLTLRRFQRRIDRVKRTRILHFMTHHKSYRCAVVEMAGKCQTRIFWTVANHISVISCLWSLFFAVIVRLCLIYNTVSFSCTDNIFEHVGKGKDCRLATITKFFENTLFWTVANRISVILYL